MKLLRTKKHKNKSNNKVENKYVVELDEDEYVAFQSGNYKLYCSPCAKMLEHTSKIESIMSKNNVHNADELEHILSTRVLDFNTLKEVVNSQSSKIGLMYSDVISKNAVIREYEKLGYGLVPEDGSNNLRFYMVDNTLGPIVLYINTVNYTVIKYINNTKYSIYLTINELVLAMRLFQQMINI